MFIRRVVALSRGLPHNPASLGNYLKPTFSLSSRTLTTVNATMADAATTPGVTVDSLKEKLEKQLGAQHVDVEDMSGGCGQAFQAIVVSPQFEKMNMLARHRLVNSVLKEEIAAIHAWTPKCYTPEQWEKLKEERS